MTFTDTIMNAFPNEPIPNADVLFLFDEEGVLEHFQGHSWNELDEETILYHSVSLRAFTGHGFAYYLPAFMVVALQNKESSVVDAVIDCLCPPKNYPSRPSFTKRWESLSHQQKIVAIQFLRNFEYTNPIAIGEATASLEATIAD